MSFTFEPQAVPDIILIKRTLHKDARGCFSESYKRTTFHGAGISVDFVQDNVVSSTQHVLRGLHYQRPPHTQGKLVCVSQGEILDVVVDLRRREPTYGKWVGVRLTADGGEMVWVPPGFAHGYLVLTPIADVAYKVTAEYDPASERGIRWDDPELKIRWPSLNPTLSEKDRVLPLLSETESPF